MTLRRSPRRRRARRAGKTILKTIRSIALVRVVLAALRRRRGLGLLARGGPIGLLAGVAAFVLARRRRQRGQLEADLGPPNESAPGHEVPPPAAASASPPEGGEAAGPNEGATGHEPAREELGQEPAPGQDGGPDGAGAAEGEPVSRQPMG